MVQYKLTYFNAMGRAEAIRLLFVDSGTPFEDFRVQFEDWPKLKPTLMFGTMPVLEVDGKQLHQSMAIYRFLGKEFGYAGKDNWENAKCDMLADGMADVYGKMVPCLMEQDAGKRKQMWEKLTNETLKSFLALYSKLLAENGTGYFVGNKITWVDLYLYCALSLLRDIDKPLLEPHPDLIKFVETIEGRPKIKDYISKRPKTPM